MGEEQWKQQTAEYEKLVKEVEGEDERTFAQSDKKTQ